MRYQLRSRWGVAVALWAVALGACDSNSGPTGDGPGTSCQPRCEAKAKSCGAPSDQATSSCSPVCARSPTESQLTCIEATDCDTLMHSDPCGLEGGGGSGGSGTGGEGTGGSVDPETCMANGNTSCKEFDACINAESPFFCLGVPIISGGSLGLALTGCPNQTVYAAQGSPGYGATCEPVTFDVTIMTTVPVGSLTSSELCKGGVLGYIYYGSDPCFNQGCDCTETSSFGWPVNQVSEGGVSAYGKFYPGESISSTALLPRCAQCAAASLGQSVFFLHCNAVGAVAAVDEATASFDPDKECYGAFWTEDGGSTAVGWCQ